MTHRAIITPTFKEHFNYIKKYIDSFEACVLDSEDIPLVFIVSDSEINELEKIIRSKRISNYKIISFDKLLKEYGIECSADHILKKYGKFSFQTLKKLLPILYLDYDQVLLLDSESMWINRCRMNDVFDKYFSSPYLTVSNLDAKQWDVFSMVEQQNIDLIFGFHQKYWPLENFVWFYEKKIIEDLVTQLGSIFEICSKVESEAVYDKYKAGVFEILLYQDYIINNNEKYGYRIYHIDTELKRVLGGKKYYDYVDTVESRYNNGGGMRTHY